MEQVYCMDEQMKYNQNCVIRFLFVCLLVREESVSPFNFQISWCQHDQLVISYGLFFSFLSSFCFLFPVLFCFFYNSEFYCNVVRHYML